MQWAHSCIFFKGLFLKGENTVAIYLSWGLKRHEMCKPVHILHIVPVREGLTQEIPIISSIQAHFTINFTCFWAISYPKLKIWA